MFTECFINCEGGLIERLAAPLTKIPAFIFSLSLMWLQVTSTEATYGLFGTGTKQTDSFMVLYGHRNHMAYLGRGKSGTGNENPDPLTSLFTQLRLAQWVTPPSCNQSDWQLKSSRGRSSKALDLSVCGLRIRTQILRERRDSSSEVRGTLKHTGSMADQASKKRVAICGGGLVRLLRILKSCRCSPCFAVKSCNLSRYIPLTTDRKLKLTKKMRIMILHKRLECNKGLFMYRVLNNVAAEYSSNLYTHHTVKEALLLHV